MYRRTEAFYVFRCAFGNERCGVAGIVSARREVGKVRKYYSARYRRSMSHLVALAVAGDVHCVLKLEGVAAAVSPSDSRVPHYNLAVRRRLRVSVLDHNGISDLQICKDNCPQAAPA